ncbi:DUF5654 family protein [Candidatus Borrarchaeum sp.]|uniref:DUF5654 family protein n=1 Tax=Candidatus Borrarchaeum sp. TaxID=2846742 RepID=UPI0025805EED|nr:DUF5654 family protein [Candidatus Borrarchaeum sp.]
MSEKKISDKRRKEKALKELRKLQKEMIDKFSTLITTAFGFVVAFAWNGAFQAIFRNIFGITNEVVPSVTYAIVVTVIAVIVTIWISKLARRYKTIEQHIVTS